jgi:hypothetical protein
MAVSGRFGRIAPLRKKKGIEDCRLEQKARLERMNGIIRTPEPEKRGTPIVADHFGQPTSIFGALLKFI